MNTNKLKKFAQETRRKLLKQVNGKLEHVLTAETGELREKAHIIKDLKKDLARMGREALVDKVAYTWFNRFVALRYMDVRGFQPLEVSVLTPKKGQVSPEVLQEAMAGHISDDLMVDRQKVMDLLDGRIKSSNAENDAFRLLLVSVCNHLHHIFPFLFERIDDYSELLLPDDLTSEFSVVRDVIDGMETEDCQQVEILGWLYQFYISEKKDEVFASKGKVTKEEIPAATQLFTPRWIVEYMVQNTVGKLWVLNHPNSGLKEHMPYYIESEVTAEDVLRIDKPEELTLLDQACGSGHILVYGFELLYRIYEEEGYAPSDIPRLIIEHNLHGFEIDERAAQLAGLAILMKAREHQRRLFRKSDVPEPKITCFVDLILSDEEIKTTLKSVGFDYSDELLHDLQIMRQATNLGSLIAPRVSLKEINQAMEVIKESLYSEDLYKEEQLEVMKRSLETLIKLGSKYSCVVDNPPYMGSGKMNIELLKFVEINYSDSKSDLMACFIERGLQSLYSEGLLGMINQHSWMFLSRYELLREKLISNTFIDTLLHLGPRTFPEISGEVVQNSAFTALGKFMNYNGFYFRLVEFDNSKKKKDKTLEAINGIDLKNLHKKKQNDFTKIPGSPYGYWLSPLMISIFDRFDQVESFAPVRQGFQTGDNLKFMRFWTEVQRYLIGTHYSNTNNFHKSKNVYAPYNKGGSFRKWYGNNDYVVKFDKSNYDLLSNLGNKLPSKHLYFKNSLTWSALSSGTFGARYCGHGFTFSAKGASAFPKDEIIQNYVLGILNSNVASKVLEVFSPTLDFNVGDIRRIPYVYEGISDEINRVIESNIKIGKNDWDSQEISWDFQQNELIRFEKEGGIETLEEAYEHFKQYWQTKFYQLHQNEEELNRQFIEIYGLQEELTPDVPLNEITILQDELDGKALKKLEKEYRSQGSDSSSKPDLPFKDKEVIAQFMSYAVGCMFGRYSLDMEGLVLANQGEDVSDYYQKVGKSSDEVQFRPDESNIIPVLDDEWFEDDIAGAFFRFMKGSFGETHFRKNVTFIEDILGKDIRSWFAKEFYKDHITRYKKRPIYWKFSSPKGHFSVLVYMHRYTQDTLNIILNTYLREFINKLSTRKEQMQHLENTGSATEKAQAAREIDKLNKMIADCQEYEREILYPLATERIPIDLDDGVLVNYNLFGQAIEQVSGLNDPKAKKKVRAFDWIDAERVR